MFFTKKRKNNEEQGGIGAIYTDFHSHVLPEVDDGSDSLETSLKMLRRAKAQGVKRMVATPHFYPHLYNPEELLKNRREGVERLTEAVLADKENRDAYPELYLGAEVAYFSGISRCDWMEKMCVAGSRILLVEMPFERWSEKVMDELFEMKTALEIIPVMAHVERYFPYQPREFIDELFAQELLIQCNAESFISFKTRKKMLGMLEDGLIDFIGSDCHDLESRAPNVGEACDIIRRKVGDEPLKKLNEFGDFVFAELPSVF